MIFSEEYFTKHGVSQKHIDRLQHFEKELKELPNKKAPKEVPDGLKNKFMKDIKQSLIDARDYYQREINSQTGMMSSGAFMDEVIKDRQQDEKLCR